MVDDLAGLMDDAGSSDSGVDTASPEQQPQQASSSEEWESRFKGLQRSLADRDRELADLRSALEEQRLASLPEDERETVRQRQSDDRVKKLQLENELLKLQRDYPQEVFDAYTTLLSGKSAAEQLDYLKSKLVPAQPEKKVEPPAVNKNNPQRTPPQGVVLPDGSVMTDDLADRILSAFKRVPKRL